MEGFKDYSIRFLKASGRWMAKHARNHPGATTSLALHLLLLLTVLGSFAWLTPDPEPINQVIRVDMLPVAQKTNTHNIKKTPVTKPKTKAKPKPPVKTVKPKPKPPAPPKPKEVVKPKPEPKKEVAKAEPKPKAPEKKVAKPKPPVKTVEPKQAENDFNSVLKSVEAMKQKTSQQPSSPNNDVTQPLTASQVDKIRSIIDREVHKYWSPTTALGAGDMVVTLNITMKPDGTVQQVNIEEKYKYNSNSSYRALADSAIRATYQASPIKELSTQFHRYYDSWKEVQMQFDPSALF